ncbi:hypothetical protein ACQ4XT_00240 [Halobacillus faecis]
MKQEKEENATMKADKTEEDPTSSEVETDKDKSRSMASERVSETAKEEEEPKDKRIKKKIKQWHV